MDQRPKIAVKVRSIIPQSSAQIEDKDPIPISQFDLSEVILIVVKARDMAQVRLGISPTGHDT